jgi:hypothetical protein
MTTGEGELKIEENNPQRLQQHIEAVLLHFDPFQIV